MDQQARKGVTLLVGELTLIIMRSHGVPYNEDGKEWVWNSAFSRVSLGASILSENGDWAVGAATSDKSKATEVPDSSSLTDVVTLPSRQPRPIKILTEGEESLV